MSKLANSDYIDIEILNLIKNKSDLPNNVEIYDRYRRGWFTISDVALKAANRQSVFGEKSWLCTWEDIWPRLRMPN